LAGRPGLKLKDLAGFPWASSVDPPALRGIDIPGRFICDNYHILRDAVLRSDLVCICSSSFVAQQLRDGTLREIKIKGLVLPETTIYMAKLRGRVLSPLAEEAVQRVRAHLKSN
jgi:DNA-binding transcriptional LysR family regulator